jgi:hypothetical protein
MTKTTEIERALVYDVSLNKFPEYADEASDFGKSIVMRQKQSQDRLIDVTFKKVFGMDMDNEKNSNCRALKLANGTIVLVYLGRPFLELGDLVHEDEVHEGEMRRRIYQEYRVLG